MVTQDKSRPWTTDTNTYFGLSTDEKPVEGVPNGSRFKEIDTKHLWLFDAANATWHDQGESGGSGGGGGEDDGDIATEADIQDIKNNIWPD